MIQSILGMDQKSIRIGRTLMIVRRYVLRVQRKRGIRVFLRGSHLSDLDNATMEAEFKSVERTWMNEGSGGRRDALR